MNLSLTYTSASLLCFFTLLLVTINNTKFSGHVAATATQDGGAIFLRSVKNAVISDTSILTNSARYGGGLRIVTSNVTIDNCDFGMLLLCYVIVVIIIVDRSSYRLSSSILSYCWQLDRNNATAVGGGLAIGHSLNTYPMLVTISNSKFRRNNAPEGGGIYAAAAIPSTLSIVLDNILVKDNTDDDPTSTPNNGIGMSFRQCCVRLSNSTGM